MFKENIDFLQTMIKDNRPAYDILSFASDTLDAMRTSLFQKKFKENDRALFDDAIQKIADALKEIDALM